jgi:hypothetical protein
MDNYQYVLIHVIEHLILNVQLNDKIHVKIFHLLKDQQVVQ